MKLGRPKDLAVALLLIAVFATVSEATQVRRTYQRIQFQRGRTTAVVKGHLGTDTFNYYYLGARAGQTMSVHITSVRHTAVFTLVKRNGELLPGAAGVDDWSGELPSNGDYEISVGSQGGRPDDYTLEVTIR